MIKSNTNSLVSLKFILLFSVLFWNRSLVAQSCLSIGITFNSQQDIDGFAANYPDCNEILGNVCIGDCSPPFDQSNIVSLDGLAQINSIGGYLWINANTALNSLSGLDQLRSIGNDLSVRQNIFLPNLAGLDSLMSIGGGLDISANTALENISGLGQVNTIGGSIEIAGNAVLNGLTGLDQISEVNGYFRLINNPSVASLEALSNITSIAGFLHLFSNNSLENLAGLNQLTAIGDLLNIGHNSALNSLEGLDNLVAIGGLLNIENNDALLHLNALEQLTAIGGSLSIKNNSSLESLSGLDNIDANTIINLFIENSNNLSECEVNSICTYLEMPNGFETSISSNAMGCSSINEVATACEIVGTDELLDEVAGIQFFPNPASTQIMINTVKPSRLFMYNTLGRLLEVIDTRQGNNVMDLSSFSPGVYFFITEKGWVGRIVKR